jgi:hypothetical protein
MDEPDEELDRVIMSVALPRWRKVAMILANSLDAMGQDLNNGEIERLAIRIVFLVRAGQLEAQGDLSQWRYSEVRLPQ